MIVGKFYLLDKYTKEDNYKNVQRLISSNNIPDMGILYKLLQDGKIYTSHICDSSKSKSVYNPPRMLGILIAIESIINWKYDKSDMRSDDYLELLDRMKKMTEEKKDELCKDLSRNKTHFTKTIKTIFKPQVSYSTFIRRVIKDYPVTLSAISTIYGTLTPERNISNIAERVNDMAHGNIITEFSDLNTKDIKFMEVLFYMILLSEMKLPNDYIIERVAFLFNLRPFSIIKQ